MIAFRESVEYMRTLSDLASNPNDPDNQPRARLGNGSQTSRERLLASTSSSTSTRSARCLKGIYHAAGNAFQTGALIGAAILTVTNLDDRQKDAVGGLTIGCIVLGTFFFWQLSCCHPQTSVGARSESFSINSDESEQNHAPFSGIKTESNTESDIDKVAGTWSTSV